MGPEAANVTFQGAMTYIYGGRRSVHDERAGGGVGPGVARSRLGGGDITLGVGARTDDPVQRAIVPDQPVPLERWVRNFRKVGPEFQEPILYKRESLECFDE